MGYQTALEAAGAKVLEFKYFNDYQQTWYALVEYDDKIGFVSGYCGSCSSCDAFEAEFGYSYNDVEDKQKLILFGKHYLNDIMTSYEVIKRHERDISWDKQSGNIIVWVKQIESKKFFDKLEKVINEN